MHQMISIPNDFQWLYPWAPIPDNYTILPSLYGEALTNWDHETGEIHSLACDTLVAELKRELPSGHVLEGLDFTTIAVDQSTHKDFLFATSDEHRPFACVHLTFIKESKPPWPWTSVFETLEAWQQEMEENHRIAEIAEIAVYDAVTEYPTEPKRQWWRFW